MGKIPTRSKAKSKKASTTTRAVKGPAKGPARRRDDQVLLQSVDTSLARSSALEFALDRPNAADGNPVIIYLAGLAAGSQRTMRQSLDRISQMVMQDEEFDARWFNWSALRFQHTQIIRSMLSRELAPSTANKCLSAMRGVLKAAWRLGQMSAEDYHRAVDIPPVRGTRLPPGRRLSVGEMTDFFQHCAHENAPGAYLDAALFAVMAGGGLRRSEVCALDLKHFHPDDQVLRVRGKGNKEREVPLGAAATAAVNAWIQAVRGLQSGALFCPVRKNGRIEIRRMTAQAIYKRLSQRTLAAGLPPFAPHDLRRTFASGLLEAGADVIAVQRILGHENVTTTTRYDIRDEKAKRTAADLYHLPYVEFSP